MNFYDTLVSYNTHSLFNLKVKYLFILSKFIKNYLHFNEDSTNNTICQNQLSNSLETFTLRSKQFIPNLGINL